MDYLDIFKYYCGDSWPPYIGLSIIGFILFWLLTVLCIPFFTLKNKKFINKHFLITGGSQGLGKSLAWKAIELGAKVTIVSRNVRVLKNAVGEIMKGTKCNTNQINYYSADVTDYDIMIKAIDEIEKNFGIIDTVITCAGQALTGHVEDNKIEDYRKSMDLNYFGTVNTVLAVLPGMKERRSGNIIFISSGMALVAYSGYSTYAPTKYAIRGFGDCLRNELLPYGINIFQAYPPAFQSPGFEQENIRKPEDTKAIEAGEPVHTSEDVADCIYDSFARGDYHSSCGNFGINLVMRLSSGLSPRNNTLADVLLSPILVIVSKIYVYLWDDAVMKNNKLIKN